MPNDRPKRKAAKNSKLEVETHQGPEMDAEDLTSTLPEPPVTQSNDPMAQDDLGCEVILDTGHREAPPLPDSSVVDETMEDDVGPKSPQSPAPQAQPPLEDWADEVEDENAKKARKLARKAIKKAKRSRKQGEWVEEMRREGKPPPTPCPNCKSDHWAANCTRPFRRSANDADWPQSSHQWEKKSEKKRGQKEKPAKDDDSTIVSTLSRTSLNPSTTASKAPSTAGMSTSTVPAQRPTKRTRKPIPKVAKKQDIPTKRLQKEAGIAETLYGDGLYVFLSTVKMGPSMPLPVLVNALLKAGVPLDDFGHIEHHGKGHMIHMKSRNAVTANTGRQIRLTSDITSVLRPYFTKGLQVFVATRSGDRPARVIAVSIRKAFPEAQFWLAREAFRGKTGAGLLNDPDNLSSHTWAAILSKT